jgi:inner membrane protein involved in colicin E2 resistance
MKMAHNLLSLVLVAAFMFDTLNRERFSIVYFSVTEKTETKKMMAKILFYVLLLSEPSSFIIIHTSYQLHHNLSTMLCTIASVATLG